jgi:thiol-disulfide isomerase/thioredoxin
MKITTIIILLAFGLNAGFCLAAPAEEIKPALSIGDRPPPLESVSWIRGVPVGEFAAGRIYVVNFFATWCGASRQSMDLMSLISKDYAADVSVVGVNVREEERAVATFEAVSDFVATWPSKFEYSVAMDDPGSKRGFHDWMTSAMMHGTPTSFIIGRDGRIAWIGIPIDDGSSYPFRKALLDAIAGKSDLAASRELHRTTAQEIARYLDEKAALREVSLAESKGDPFGVVMAIDAVVAAKPEYRERTLYTKLQALLELDEASALAFANDEFDHLASGGDEERADLIASSLGRTILRKKALSSAALGAAVSYLTEGFDVRKRNFDTFLTALSLAELQCRRGLRSEAIRNQELAIELAGHVNEVSEDMHLQISNELESYRVGCDR